MPLTEAEQREQARMVAVMYDRSERMEKAMFGDGARDGVLSDVNRLTTKVKFMQWMGGVGAVALIGVLLHTFGLA